MQRSTLNTQRSTLNIGDFNVERLVFSVESCMFHISFRVYREASAIFLHIVNSGSTSLRSRTVAESLLAFLGSGWHSRNNPSTPAATAARARRGEYCGLPP